MRDFISQFDGRMGQLKISGSSWVTKKWRREVATKLKHRQFRLTAVLDFKSNYVG